MTTIVHCQAGRLRLRGNITVRNRWLSEQLSMGHETRASQSVRAVAEAEDGELLSLRQSLVRMPKNHGLTPSLN